MEIGDLKGLITENPIADPHVMLSATLAADRFTLARREALAVRIQRSALRPVGR